MSAPEPEAPLAETIQEASKDARATFIFVFVMAIVQLISVTIYTVNSAKDRNEEAQQQALNRQLKIIENIYDRQDKKYKEIEYPLISMRVILNEIYKTCNDKNIMPNERKNRLDDLKEQRIKDKIALIQAYGASEIVFGNLLFNKIKSLLVDLEKTEVLNDTELCTLITPEYEERIKNENREIDQLMYNAMQKTEKNLSFVLSKEKF